MQQSTDAAVPVLCLSGWHAAGSTAQPQLLWLPHTDTGGTHSQQHQYAPQLQLSIVMVDAGLYCRVGKMTLRELTAIIKTC